MFASTTGVETNFWDNGDGHSIEYSLDALDEVRRLAVDGFNAFMHGGLETGGVLYGLREPGRIVILSCAELAVEHSHGPGFVLSESDHAVLSKLMDGPEGLETVGFFRAHTRGGLQLDSRDVELFEQYFGKATSAALIVKPTAWGPASAGFFVRSASGEVQPAEPRAFLLEPLPGSANPRADEIAPPVSQETWGDQAAQIAALSDAGSAKPAAGPLPVAARRKQPRLAWIVPVCAGALIGALASLVDWSQPPSRLELQASSIAPGQVRIAWNRHSKPVRESASGLLEILDGGATTRMPLDTERIHSTSVTYTQRTGNITVRLKMFARKSGALVGQEAIEFVGQPAPAPSAAAAPVPPPAPAPDSAPARRQTRAERRAAAKAARARQNPPAPVKPSQAYAERAPQNPPPPMKAAPKTVVLAGRSTPTVAPAAVLPAPPVLTATAPQPTGLPDLSVHAPPRVTPPPAPSNTYSGPRSGRLIWTGVLGKRGVMEIDGSHPTTGTLTGALPGVPVSLHVLPAEFGRDGLTAYTADQARAGKGEAASKSNGWNALHFKFDDTRARELVVLEAPNGSNDNARLVVRNEGRNYSVVVIDWTVK